MAKSFTAQVEQMIANSKEAMLAVVQGSIRDMTNDMQIPVAKGGRMRVDTGFLRASARASLNGMPSGRSQKNAEELAVTGMKTGRFDTFDGQAINAVLLDMKLGDTFSFGWVAEYALTRERYDGFRDTALQNFQQYVNSNADKIRGR